MDLEPDSKTLEERSSTSSPVQYQQETLLDKAAPYLILTSIGSGIAAGLLGARAAYTYIVDAIFGTPVKDYWDKLADNFCYASVALLIVAGVSFGILMCKPGEKK